METSDDGVCMLIDYVAGKSLKEFLISEPEYFLSEKNLRRFLNQLLKGLDYLHSHQIVHCDLTTSNILLTQVDKSVKILDLGFCYTDSYSTLTGKTDEFAAPEQFIGSSDEIDQRTDIYALGKILEKIENEAYIPAGQHLPRRIEKLKNKCLNRDKSDRPQYAKECMNMLASMRRRHIISMQILFVLGLILFCCINDSARKVISYTAKNIHLTSYDIADLHGNKYRILSEKDSTCQAIGHKHISEKASANLILEPKVTHFGKTYRVISIATSAFEYDTLLRSVFIPEGIEDIGPRTFKACKKIISLTLPDTMKNLGEDCFSNNTTLERVVLPNGLGTLENNMFENCTSLKDIIIPEGIETIDRDCFVNCRSLSYIKPPATLKTISRGVFYNCSALKEITIPASVTTIGDYAFLFCNSLTDIYNLAETPQIVAEIFNQEHLTIHVPAGSVDDYRTTPPWNMYDIVPIE